jgi:hypothetical protein
MSRLTGLRAIGPAEAELRRVVVAALTGLDVDGVPTAACVPAAQTHAGGWLRFECGIALAIDRLDGAPVRIDPANALGAAALVERAEPLIAAIEAALGVALDPADLAEAPPAGIVVVIDHDAAARLRLAIPTDLALLPRPATFAPALIGAAALAARITLPGPRVAPLAAAGLTAGDLVLLGPGPLSARFEAGGIARVASFDPTARTLRIQSTGAA